ncbi:uncharacterized protein LOC131022889 [Salvia miltiorrhiza]|uniref:uncharacterized protein LOC131022889 n=1 Tax=Salvia miltiorrhiza TaxID=226208 RepID=UPI0025ACC3FF|nr:uncharacterized protein LOC131022889 [Salvia miltiorrhiza]
MVWTRWTGVPLQAWNPRFFEAFGARMGMVLKIHELTKSKERLDMAFIQISTGLASINKVIECKINGAHFKVRVEEVDEFYMSGKLQDKDEVVLSEEESFGDEEDEEELSESPAAAQIIGDSILNQSRGVLGPFPTFHANLSCSTQDTAVLPTPEDDYLHAAHEQSWERQFPIQNVQDCNGAGDPSGEFSKRHEVLEEADLVKESLCHDGPTVDNLQISMGRFPNIDIAGPKVVESPCGPEQEREGSSKGGNEQMPEPNSFNESGAQCEQPISKETSGLDRVDAERSKRSQVQRRKKIGGEFPFKMGLFNLLHNRSKKLPSSKLLLRKAAIGRATPSLSLDGENEGGFTGGISNPTKNSETEDSQIEEGRRIWDFGKQLGLSSTAGDLEIAKVMVGMKESGGDEEKQEREQLWDRLESVVRQNKDLCVCIGGDFNSIRNRSERVGRGIQFSARDVQMFDHFVRRCGLEEIRLQARSFMWYQPQGQCKSKLDRFLVNEEWLAVWTHTKARGLQRSVSDHCPILLETKRVDWGPKPFRFINAWTKHQDFEEVVTNSWQRGGISGWSSFVFKEKIKRLKEDLKEWSRSGFGIVEENISKLKDEISKWDSIDDVFGLDDEEATMRSEAEANLLIQIQHRDSTLSQRARNRWLRDGDLNSSLFHKAINGRRAKNEISGLSVDGAWIEEPAEVKRLVKEHFQTQFKTRHKDCLTLPADFVNRKLSDTTREWLDRPFSEEEIKEAVWNCDSGKSPGPDGFNSCL